MKKRSKILRIGGIVALGVIAWMCLQCGDSNNGDNNINNSSDAGNDTKSETDSTGDIHSMGCGKNLTIPESDVQQTVEIDGTTRYYLLNVPANLDNETPHPLIFALHGYDMNNVAIAHLYNFNLCSKGEAITVYPQGEGPPPGDTPHWGDHVLESTWMNNEANYTFIKTLMTELEDRFCIDKSRVFITGFSMGGMFTNAIACDHNDWFRGFAPVEGGGPENCDDANVKSAIIIHQGTADTIVRPEKGEASRDFWIQQNECDEETTSTLNGCVTYESCPDEKPVVYCIGNWDHTVKSIATSNIWQFFNSLP